MYNLRQYFNPMGGYFRCPINGTCMFIATLTLAEPYVSVTLYLKKSGTLYMPYSVPRNPHNETYSGAPMWIMSCDVASEAYLDLQNWRRTGKINVKGARWTVFSGFMLSVGH